MLETFLNRAKFGRVGDLTLRIRSAFIVTNSALKEIPYPILYKVLINQRPLNQRVGLKTYNGDDGTIKWLWVDAIHETKSDIR